METCPNCRATGWRRHHIMYAGWHTPGNDDEPQFVIVPHIAAWLCDVCGAKVLDETERVWLTAVLGPSVDMEGADVEHVRRGQEVLPGAPAGENKRERA